MNASNQTPATEYYGTKRISATPMTRLEYNQFRKWELPKDENGADEGYLVEYLDGGKPNVEGYAGYVSWSPKEQFDAAYQPVTAMSFGHALVALQAGHKVARQGWNGKGMFLVFIPATVDAKLKEGTPYEVALGSNIVTINGHIDMFTADGKMQPGWLASQTDMLASDWQISGATAQREDATGAANDDKQDFNNRFVALARSAVEEVHKASGVTSDVSNAVHEKLADILDAG